MGYVAIKGGEEAIENSLSFYENMLEDTNNLDEKDVCNALRFAVDKVMSEGSLYSKKLSSIAIKKSAGDLLNAAFFLRAHRSSCQRIGIAKTIDVNNMKLVRRISSAFKDIQGGQLLGPSNDYEVKLMLNKSYLNSKWEDFSDKENIISSALDPLRARNLVKTLPCDKEISDVTRVFPQPPYPRSAVLQILTRGEAGSMLGFAYTSIRGYGDVHPTIGDLRLGTCELKFTHPLTKNEVKIGELELTSCESAGMFEKQENGEVKLTTGFGFCFGFNETKAISMSIIDLSLYSAKFSVGEKEFASDFEMIVHHVDGVDSMGFTNHFKLPHYVTFQADLQVFNNASNFSKDNK
ncbi:carbon-phosphorus lyase complex subunit PhnI [Aliarcobacter cibarius]|jgi:alpha-D-ribose 1-methylphosphonate 5-triphosphate synthase subunit PhnI|uniref:Phosphonate metabolism protein n=1 Tax=Aliarcobacter cibarius TaxID=255507 RepID=A0ABY2V4Z7_9BACT|nr:carbon-phosphorus lyase complex subunit PhnI [Aliarcobacter cibarius]MDD2974819.1 carbon-phosphorus lyase complex subunit PhnI [Aliarcobacter cryaerophilus]TLS97591.1 phosphonate metabolism protein [Aliarcobacter cibarius]TLS98106.1 phosphonate metabolism protein [Aliarcobacter cibarius]